MTTKVVKPEVTAYFDSVRLPSGAQVSFSFIGFPSVETLLAEIDKLPIGPESSPIHEISKPSPSHEAALDSAEREYLISKVAPAEQAIAGFTKEQVVEAIITVAREKDYDTALKVIRMFTKEDGTPADRAGDIAANQYAAVMDTIARLK